jgi:Uma2 family endonuclease
LFFIACIPIGCPQNTIYIHSHNKFSLMISSLPFPKMTVSEYLDWEPQQEQRYEYIYGNVLAMTGGTVPHNDIAINLLTALLPHVRNNGCRINLADVKLLVNEDGLYYYPDLLISCHPQDLNARKFIQFPSLVAEVLSPGTADKDRTDKFTDYQGIATLQEYLLISSERVSVECYRRGEGRMWLYYPYGIGDEIELESVGITVPINDLYLGVNFEI